MASDASPSLWIGTPQRGRTLEDVLDPYTSKIGGKAACFRVGSTATERLDAAALSKYFQCPQCKSAAQVSLVSQIYAPVAVYDRVLYVLTCAACTRKPAAGPSGSAPASGSAIPSGGGKKSSLAAAAATKSLTSFCFAVRSQNFSRDYFAELQEEEQRKAAQQRAAAQSDKAEGEAPLFGEADDDWGDDDDAQAPVFGASASAPPKTDGATASTAAEAEAAAVPEEQTSYPLAEYGATAAVKGQLYTDGLPLDLYVVPPRAKPKDLSIEEQLAVAERMYGDSAAVDTSGFEEDDETPAEACVREYMEAMEATPSQCVRWCLGGAPLRTSLLAVGASGGATPPPCPACGAPRQFEMQLTAPTVYFLTKDIGEAKNATLHFSNVLVYTCSKHCYGGASSSPPYLPEYVVVEDEL